MDDRLTKSFIRFFHDNKRNRIENDGCATWNEILTDLPFFDGKQPRISIVFSRYQGHTTNMTIIKTILDNGPNAGSEQIMGFVLALPSYWLEVDEYLALNHIETYIDAFIAEHFDNGQGGGECPVCPDHCPNIPPPPPPRPPHPHPPVCPPPGSPFDPSPFLEPADPSNLINPNIAEFNKPD